VFNAHDNLHDIGRRSATQVNTAAADVAPLYKVERVCSVHSVPVCLVLLGACLLAHQYPRFCTAAVHTRAGSAFALHTRAGSVTLARLHTYPTSMLSTYNVEL